MAPECMRMEEYNLKADVYSFSIVVWEILSGDAPYGFVRSRDELYHHVLEKNGRPEIDKRWPSDIKGMLESSFDVDPEKRPKMQPFYDIIKNTLVELRGGDQKGLTNSAINQRRSVWSIGSLLSNKWLREDSTATLGEQIGND